MEKKQILLLDMYDVFIKDFFTKFTEAGNLFLDSRPTVLLYCPFCLQFFTLSSGSPAYPAYRPMPLHKLYPSFLSSLRE